MRFNSQCHEIGQHILPKLHTKVVNDKFVTEMMMTSSPPGKMAHFNKYGSSTVHNTPYEIFCPNEFSVGDHAKVPCLPENWQL